jgi:hypothetical protein
MSLDRSSVRVMSQETWDMMKDKLTTEATYRADPIGYLSRYDGIEVFIDDDLPYNTVEVYERYMYDAISIYKKRSDTNAN